MGSLAPLPAHPHLCARAVLPEIDGAAGRLRLQGAGQPTARPEARAHAGRRKEGEGRLSGEGAHLIGFDGTTVGSTIVPMMMLVI